MLFSQDKNYSRLNLKGKCHFIHYLDYYCPNVVDKGGEEDIYSPQEHTI